MTGDYENIGLLGEGDLNLDGEDMAVGDIFTDFIGTTPVGVVIQPVRDYPVLCNSGGQDFWWCWNAWDSDDGIFTPAYGGESIVTIINRTPYSLSYQPTWLGGHPLEQGGYADVSIVSQSARCSPMPDPETQRGGVNHLVEKLVSASNEISEGYSDKMLDILKLSKDIMEDK